MKTLRYKYKASAVLVNAAEYLDREEFIREGACFAIQQNLPEFGRVPKGLENSVMRAEEYFRSLYYRRGNIWWFGDDFDDPKKRKLQRQHRIMALLMTAAMAESVGD